MGPVLQPPLQSGGASRDVRGVLRAVAKSHCQAINAVNRRRVAVPSDGAGRNAREQNGVAKWGVVGYRGAQVDQRAGVARLLPPHHSRPEVSSGDQELQPHTIRGERTEDLGLPRPARAQPRREGSADDPVAAPRAARRRRCPGRGPRPLRRDLAARRASTTSRSRSSPGSTRSSSKRRMMRRRFHANAEDETLDSAGRVRIAKHLIEHGDLAGCLHRGRRRRPPRGLESRALGRAVGGDGRQGRRCRRGARSRATGHGTTGERGPQPAMATLIYMPTEHVPVLAPELIALCDPQPGELAVDCTFGGGGHARLIAERLGPTGTLVCIDRDPSAAERFAEIRGELGCQARFIRARLRRRALESSAAEGVVADVVYMDLGDLLDAARRLGARLLVLLRRAAGHADGPRRGAVGARAS